jgi:hypothetical protein
MMDKIKGVNLGSWLLMEGYILGGRNFGETQFKKRFEKLYGKKALLDFERLFRDNYIREIDFKNIAAMGANTIRLPFNARLIETKPYFYEEKGFAYLAKALDLAHKYGLKVILDLHAAPGAQNYDWHSDSNGKALFWSKKEFRRRAILLWERVIDRFKEKPALLGYDVINEPVLAGADIAILKDFYKEALRSIKTIDRTHEIFLEGDNWGQNIDFLKDLIEDRVTVSIHTYLPLNFTFNFRPFYKFPGNIEGVKWDKDRMRKYILPYYKFAVRNKVKIFVGEFGINWRGGFWGELDWLKSILGVFEEFGFGYTYWTYKAMAHHAYPDGLYQNISNSKYIRRDGNIYGWENYLEYWGKEREHIVDFWQTKNFTPNKGIIPVLSKFFKK